MTDKEMWKVVSVDHNGALHSAMLTRWAPAAVRYIPNKRVYPIVEGSPLFVFSDREAALRWSASDQEVWRCIAHDVSRRKPKLIIHWPLLDDDAGVRLIDRLWNKRKLPKLEYKTAPPLEHTAYCGSVTLLERIWPKPPTDRERWLPP
jgi:hypothetical protein